MVEVNSLPKCLAFLYIILKRIRPTVPKINKVLMAIFMSIATKPAVKMNNKERSEKRVMELPIKLTKIM